MIVSYLTHMWIVALACGLASIYWVGVDSVRLKRALAGDRKDPAIKDRIFGSIIGLVVATVGIVGVLHFLVKHDMI